MVLKSSTMLVKTVNEEAFFFSKTLSRVEIFENAGFAFARERKQTEVFEYNDVIHHILLVLRMLREKCYGILLRYFLIDHVQFFTTFYIFRRLTYFCRFLVDGRKRFKYATCQREFFLKTDKKYLPFQKYLDTCGQSLV